MNDLGALLSIEPLTATWLGAQLSEELARSATRDDATILPLLACAGLLSCASLIQGAAKSELAFVGAALSGLLLITFGAIGSRTSSLEVVASIGWIAVATVFALSWRLQWWKRIPTYLLLSGLLGGLLAYFSGDAGAADPMAEFFRNTLGLTKDAAEAATIALRKTIHFTYFGIIAWTAFQGAVRLEIPMRRAALFALLWTAVFAAYDELTQLTTASRTGSALDFGLDMLGAATFVGLAAVRSARSNPDRPKF